jgi:hypothetical protein
LPILPHSSDLCVPTRLPLFVCQLGFLCVCLYLRHSQTSSRISKSTHVHMQKTPPMHPQFFRLSSTIINSSYPRVDEQKRGGADFVRKVSFVSPTLARRSRSPSDSLIQLRMLT